MGVRGRRSAAALTVISGDGISVMPRPKPPAELTSEQAAEWNLVVNRMRADWFTDETLPLLAQYCRHVVAARRVSALIQGLEADLAAGRYGPPDHGEGDEDDGGEGLGFRIKDYDRLLKMQERESRAIATLSTKMRLAQQSTYDKKARKAGNAHVRKPWEAD
jgi:hypothetical protein